MIDKLLGRVSEMEIERLDKEVQELRGMLARLFSQVDDLAKTLLRVAETQKALADVIRAIVDGGGGRTPPTTPLTGAKA